MDQLTLNADGVRPETLEKYKRMKELLKEGTPLKDAYKKANLSAVSYQKLKRLDSEPVHLRVGRAKRKTQEKNEGPTYIDLPMQQETPSDENVVIIVARASQLKDVLGKLK